MSNTTTNTKGTWNQIFLRPTLGQQHFVIPGYWNADSEPMELGSHLQQHAFNQRTELLSFPLTLTTNDKSEFTQNWSNLDFKSCTHSGSHLPQLGAAYQRTFWPNTPPPYTWRMSTCREKWRLEQASAYIHTHTHTREHTLTW